MLVVDDEPINILALSGMLANKGFDSEEAKCGQEAIQAVERRIELVKEGKADMFRLILLDYCMPDWDGPQTACAIRALCNQTADVCSIPQPFICCCTAYTEEKFK